MTKVDSLGRTIGRLMPRKKRQPPPRPPYDRQPSTTLSVRIPVDARRELEAIAHRQNTSLNFLVKRILIEYLTEDCGMTLKWLVHRPEIGPVIYVAYLGKVRVGSFTRSLTGDGYTPYVHLPGVDLNQFTNRPVIKNPPEYYQYLSNLTEAAAKHIIEDAVDWWLSETQLQYREPKK